MGKTVNIRTDFHIPLDAVPDQTKLGEPYTVKEMKIDFSICFRFYGCFNIYTKKIPVKIVDQNEQKAIFGSHVSELKSVQPQ
jgi:hypothetical protein